VCVCVCVCVSVLCWLFMQFTGIPDHVLTLKKGAPYIVMHNTAPDLCNGTRVIYHRRVGRCVCV
jgi:hypothetical protein